ncbi:AI-2E family transporter [Thermoflavimicrobium dichotomicum]|uniref:Sporulation integral membrane protein YtvI n=1 Tax=Thermoflavimicrobium dichotomicum TaxID=46223 RepID=A0A1I3MWH4_9BACL|nr:AI-2E family transporter [Thermoflavimicrobium dichotomicum]SFJ01353.1 sporulation integral membrane protein YtvI [Thermoflavimicrobium dichotomicum]
MKKWTESRLLTISLLILIFLAILFLLSHMGSLFKAIGYFIKAVIGPFLIAMIISYLLNPIVNVLSQRMVPRSLAVLIIYTLFVSSFVILVMNLFPMIEKQLNELAEHLPEWNRRIESLVDEYNHHGKDMLPQSIQMGVERALKRIEQSISDGIGNMMSGVGNTINQFFLALIIPFLAFYMMKDARDLERSLIAILPRDKRRQIVRLLKDMDQALGSYVRGQFIVCLAVGLLAYIGYLIIGLPYALILALVVSVFNIIPYLGPFIGAIPAVLVAISEEKEMVMGVIVVNLIVQVLEGNILSPQIVGRTLHMHPLFIILALLVGGEMGGAVGLILAVPIFAVGKVIFEHIVSYYIQHRI